MFWILGGDAIGQALGKMRPGGWLGVVATQLEHVEWEGFHFYDLIFPMFVFIVGVSMVFSLGKLLQTEGRAGAVRRIVGRSVLLYLLGIFYYHGWENGVESIRLMGVLQRIALCYLFAGLLFCFFRPTGLLIWCLGLLIAYWALMCWMPVPGIGAGHFEEGKNLANWIDSRYLPFRKWDGDHDPEGLLSTLPAICSCLFGVFAGLLLKDPARKPSRKILLLVGGGLAALGAGWLWSLHFPVIKKIWTSSYVLVAAGWSAILLAGFYAIIDVANWKRWALPFVWIGMNPITIYMMRNLVRFNDVAPRLVGGPVKEFMDTAVPGLGDLLIAFTGMLLALWVCWFLYRRKIFLRV